MRSYLVIPEGTPILRVTASAPHFAASKARAGKGEWVDLTEASVVPASSVLVSDERSQQIPGQLSWPADEGEVRA